MVNMFDFSFSFGLIGHGWVCLYFRVKLVMAGWCLYFRVKLVMASWCLYFRVKLVITGWCLYFRVSDEKDARGYLQALATKMTEELENLKVGVPGDDVVSWFLLVAVPRKYPVVGFSSHLSVFSPPPHPCASVALLNLRLLLPCFIPVFARSGLLNALQVYSPSPPPTSWVLTCKVV